MRTFISLAFAFVAATSASGSWAKGEDCAAALIPDKSAMASDITVFASYFASLDKSSYERLDRRSDFFGQAVIYGVPIKIDTSWEKVDEARKEFMSKYDFRIQSRGINTHLLSKVPESAFKAFQECIRSSSYESFGPKLIPISVGGNRVDLGKVCKTRPAAPLSRAHAAELPPCAMCGPT